MSSLQDLLVGCGLPASFEGSALGPAFADTNAQVVMEMVCEDEV